MVYLKIAACDVTAEQFNQMVLVENNAGGDPCSIDELQGTINYIGNDNFVCIHKGTIIAFATINKNSRRLGGSIYIVNLSVHKKFQRMGIAQNIIKTACEEYIKEFKDKYITLHVSKDNIKAVNLYKKLGFEIRTDFIEDENDFAMATPLSNLKQRYADNVFSKNNEQV